MSERDQLGLAAHRPVRRSESQGGCDLCGRALDSDVHRGELAETSSPGELERAMSSVPRRSDGTLVTLAHELDSLAREREE